MKKRVVITGMGAITPLAHNVKDLFQTQLEGRSGVGPIAHFDARKFPTKFAAQVKDFDLSRFVRDAALDKKAEDFTAIDVSGRTILADTFVVVTGRSKIQTRAIADSIAEAVERDGGSVNRVEGYGEGGWILIDLGNAIVHVFTPEQRDFYNIERLWSPAAQRRVSGNP